MKANAFNPTMVRLLLVVRKAEKKSSEGFQSHNGAIAALRIH